MPQMNLDLLYLATELTGDRKYAEAATSQAEKTMNSHVRPDFTTYHVVNMNRDGTVDSCFTHQGECPAVKSGGFVTLYSRLTL